LNKKTLPQQPKTRNSLLSAT